MVIELMEFYITANCLELVGGWEDSESEIESIKVWMSSYFNRIQGDKRTKLEFVSGEFSYSMQFRNRLCF